MLPLPKTVTGTAYLSAGYSTSAPLRVVRIKNGRPQSVRSLGGVWVVAEGRSDEDEDPHLSIMTLGFDPEKGRCVGSFVSSMMPMLWLYQGELDPSANKVVLNSRGPSAAGDGTTADYRDTIEFVTPDHRVLTSSYQDAAGEWRLFMTAHYRRVS